MVGQLAVTLNHEINSPLAAISGNAELLARLLKDAPPEVDRPFIWGGEWWSAITETGVNGDASVATKEKGEKLLEATVDALVKIIKAAKAWEIRKRKDHH